LTVKELRKLEKWKWSTQGLVSSARDHVGKFLDHMDPNNMKALEEIIIDAALAAQSFNVFNGKQNGSITAVIGPIGLKLATAPAGVGIPVAQTAGLAILAALGIASAGGTSLLVNAITAAGGGNPPTTALPVTGPLIGSVGAGLAGLLSSLNILGASLADLSKLTAYLNSQAGVYASGVGH
jgi:hypothetical protein